jgi:nitrilase
MVTKIAAIQATPVFLDRAATVDKACTLVKEAAAAGAALVVLPEAFVPGYPDWVWRAPAWSGQQEKLTARLLDQSVVLNDESCARLGDAARDAQAYVAIGVNERAGGTLYNTLLYFGPDGTLLQRHRKLMPTGGERAVWGYGDGSELGVIRTPFGVVGGLLCWENYMPLARAAIYAQGVDIYLAPTWDSSEEWVASMQHIAKEGRCYVLGVNTVMRGSDVPAELAPTKMYDGADDWCSVGRTVICDPYGHIVAGPVVKEEAILYVDFDPAVIAAARQQFDPVGHYARPDVFSLRVDARAKAAVVFDS